MRPGPALLALLLVAAALGATAQAQVPSPPTLPPPPGPDVQVLSIAVAGPQPQWVNGTANNTSLRTTVVNRGDQPAHYTLSYEWVGADGAARPLNVDEAASQDVSSSPSDRTALDPSETRTHDPMPWTLQQGQEGAGWVRVTVLSGSHQRSGQAPVFIPVHRLGLTFDAGDLSLRPGETGFLRATLDNLGNVAENITFLLTDPERKDGAVDNTQLRKTLDPVTVRVAPQAQQRVTLFAQRAFDLDVGQPFAAQFTLRAAAPLLSTQAVSPIVRSNDTAGGFPPGFAFSLQAVSTAPRFVAPGTQAPVAFRLANLASASSPARLDDTYHVTAAASDGWVVAPAALWLGLRPGESNIFEATVRPPADAPPGARATLTVTAVSDHTEAVQSAEVPLRAGGPAVRILSLEMASGAPYLGEAGDLAIRLANAGDQPTPSSSQVQVTLPGLPATLSLVPPLGAGEEATVHATLGPFKQPGPTVAQATWSDPGGQIPSQADSLPLLVHEPRLAVLPPGAGLSGVPGERVAYLLAPSAFRVRNDGNAAERVLLEATTGVGAARVEGEAAVLLEPGEVRTVAVSHELPRPSGLLASATLRLAARVAGGHGPTWSAAVATSIVDRAPPRLELATPLPTLWTVGEPLVLAATVSDDGAVASVRANLTRDGTRLAPLQLSLVGARWEATVTFSQRGEHTFTLLARDAAGNLATLVRSVQAAPIPPPSLQVLDLAGNATLADARLRIVAADPLGVAAVTVRPVGGNATLTFHDPNGTLEANLTGLALPPGSHLLRVEAVNRAGARANATLPVTILAPPAPAPPPPAPARSTPGLSPLLAVLAVAAAGHTLTTARRAQRGR